MALQEQVVLITGCSSGIGRALSLELHARGHRVYATARNPTSLADLPCEALGLDVTDPESISKSVAEILRKAGHIDMLINNAGFNLVGPLAEVPLEGVRALFETNLTGLLAVTQAVFPYMAKRRSGRIVNLGSVVGLLPTPFAGPYCATKAAVHMLTDVLRMECTPFGIDVIEVQPGGVRSSIAQTASAGLERYGHANSLYRGHQAHMLKRANASQVQAMDANVFAGRVARAILAARAPRLVREGRGAVAYPALSRLPAAFLDRALQRRFGLDQPTMSSLIIERAMAGRKRS